MDEWIASVVLNAFASCFMAKRLTNGIQSTAVRKQTWILTSAVNAGAIFGTIVVVSATRDALGILANLAQDAFTVSKTLWRSLCTKHIRVALEPLRACAQCRMVVRSTNGIAPTDTEKTTRVLTNSVDARFL